MTQSVIILGLESSCDDTAAAVLNVTRDGHGTILSSVVARQDDLHRPFGGVVPEIAARAHTEKLDLCARSALTQADATLAEIDAVAVTAGPGLIGGVLAGVMFAKGLSASAGLPLVGVNHLAGHALTPRLSHHLAFPYLLLLVSGGHCQFLIVKSESDFVRLGGTIDDAPGEAFDKTARLLGLPQPGGPSVETCAEKGDMNRFQLPRPLLDRDDCNMSFSGLKTALLRARNDLIDRQGGLTRQDRSDLCASFQSAITQVLVEKSRRELKVYMADVKTNPSFAVAGGVAANDVIRTALRELCHDKGVRFAAPPMALCTDNAAMIAYAGGLQFLNGHCDDLGLSARPRWPLDQTQPALIGSGRKGAKA